MGIDSSFLRKENKLPIMGVKCATCGTKIELFINSIASAGDVWPFCARCGAYVDVLPSD